MDRIPPYAFPYGTIVFEHVYRGFGAKDAISREAVVSAFERSEHANNIIRDVKSNGASHLSMDYWVLI